MTRLISSLWAFTRWAGLAAVLAGSVGAARAQSRYQIDHLSLEEGVANNLAYCMLQDATGFLWFGTMYGLVRYDGETYVAYRYNPENPGSLSNDDIVALYEDRAQNLWIACFGGGLNKIDRATGRIIRYLHDPADSMSVTGGTVWSISEDHAGKLWLATSMGLAIRGGHLRAEGDIDFRGTLGVARGVPHRIAGLDAAFRYICNHNDVWWATGEEIVNAYLASDAKI